jgi:hypothetical protein
MCRHVVVIIVSLVAARVDAQPASAPVTVDGKIDRTTDQLLIPMRIGPGTGWCSLDTGFSALFVIDRAKAVSLGLEVTAGVPTPDGAPPSKGDGSASATVSVGSIPLGTRTAIIRDLPDEAPEMECLVGGAMLREFMFEIDYGAARLRLFRPEAFTPAAGSIEVPLVFRSNPNVAFVRVEVRFADGSAQQAQLVADTGASYYSAVFAGPAAARIRTAVTQTAKTAGQPKGPFGPITLSAARPATLVVGGVAVTQPVVALLESDLGSDGIDDGLLGCGFFRLFTVTFDYQGKRMFLRPTARASEPHLFDASGASFRFDGATFVVDNVLADSPAADAGLKIGDELIDVDDRSTDNMAPTALRDALSQPGQTRRLRVLRGDQVMRVSLLLRKRL